MNTITATIDALRQAREEQILQLLKEGTTYQRCAEITGVSVTTVVTVARKNGIRRKEQEQTEPINQ